MKVWKKLAGVVLALAVMMSLTVSAWATPGTLLSGTTAYSDANFTEIDGTSFTVTITNDNTVSPGYKATYSVTYTIQNASGTTLTDGAVYFSDSTADSNGAKKKIPSRLIIPPPQMPRVLPRRR